MGLVAACHLLTENSLQADVFDVSDENSASNEILKMKKTKTTKKP